ncbi:MAG TPA: lysophospholipid acyltransferase family protein [Baekduia sp.]|nr:lysophospholipid acyltransferase family protein [Baekduia sp.]
MADRAHERARGRGISRPLYWAIRLLLTPLLRGWFRLTIRGAEHLPDAGPAILAPNHKSFLDPFFLSLATRRPLRFMAKVELFRGPLRWLFPRLGAFPVRRGETDAEAMATARALLERGELVVLFLEGTRVDEPDALGAPHHGAARLACETGAPILPTAISGTAHLWLGPVPKPRHVRIAIVDPVVPPEGPDAVAAMSALIDRRVWPAVQEEYGWLQATPGVVVAALAATGLGAGLVARRQRRAAPPRVLGVVPPKRLRRRRVRGERLARAARAPRAAVDRLRRALHR